MLKKLLVFLFFSQVSINSSCTEPDNSAMMDINSTTKGVLIHRMTTAQHNAINTPALGLMVYDTQDSCIFLWTGNQWTSLCNTTYGFCVRCLKNNE